jgi:hypothetical protein
LDRAQTLGKALFEQGIAPKGHAIPRLAKRLSLAATDSISPMLKIKKGFDQADGSAGERNRPTRHGDFSLTSPGTLVSLSADGRDAFYCHQNPVLLSLTALAPAGLSAIWSLQNLISSQHFSTGA